MRLNPLLRGISLREKRPRVLQPFWTCCRTSRSCPRDRLKDRALDRAHFPSPSLDEATGGISASELETKQAERLREKAKTGSVQVTEGPAGAEQWLVPGLLHTSRCVCQDGPGSDPETDKPSASATAGQTRDASLTDAARPVGLLSIRVAHTCVTPLGGGGTSATPLVRPGHTAKPTWRTGNSLWPPAVHLVMLGALQCLIFAQVSPHHPTPRCAVLTTSHRGASQSTGPHPPPSRIHKPPISGVQPRHWQLQNSPMN